MSLQQTTWNLWGLKYPMFSPRSWTTFITVPLESTTPEITTFIPKSAVISQQLADTDQRSVRIMASWSGLFMCVCFYKTVQIWAAAAPQRALIKPQNQWSWLQRPYCVVNKGQSCKYAIKDYFELTAKWACFSWLSNIIKCKKQHQSLNK